VAELEVIATDVTGAAEDGAMIFKTMTGGAAATEKFRVGADESYFSGQLSTNAATYIGDGGDLIQTYLDATPAADATWSGAKAAAVAGEAIAVGELIYHQQGTDKWYLYDADAANKEHNQLAFAVTLASGDAQAFVRTVGPGYFRLDSWAFTASTDEGKEVYATTTAGAISVTAPSASLDVRRVVGYVEDAIGILEVNISKSYTVLP